MTKKQQIKELARMLGIANETIHDQMQEIDTLNKLAVYKKISIKNLAKMYENQIEGQDREIHRLTIIKHYLEEKCLKVYE